MLEAAFAHVTEIVTGFGRLGTSAESLAKTALFTGLRFSFVQQESGVHLVSAG